MVCDWGMSDLGPLAYGKKEEAIFLGREIAQHRDYSEDTAIRIDAEVKKIITTAYSRAKTTLESHRDALERIALALLERESLDANQIRTLIEGKPLPERPPTTSNQPPAQALPSTEPKPVTRPELRPAPGFSKG
jgi:cell division protease FtsH